MIVFKFKELLDSHNISRYKFQQMSKWNYKRINTFYFGTVKLMTVDELNTVCKLFNCKLSDVIEYKD